MHSETWGEDPPIERMPAQEPAEYIAEYLDQMNECIEDEYDQEIIRMAVELLRNRRPL